MEHYILWFNLKKSYGGKDFVLDLDEYMLTLQDKKLIAEYRIVRRKLGFGPPELGEFMVDIAFNDMAQLDNAFKTVIQGIHEDNELEKLHRRVNSQVENFRTSLYRDYPDEHLSAG
ncbi:MAG: hypothetical protein OEZ36_03485 [Spirochaetota bacterium]|nr:hypothetical protein [Spirochaetota bacterium]